jgi:hypothetical protein
MNRSGTSIRAFSTRVSGLLIALILFSLGRVHATEKDGVEAVFAGTTPCGPGVKPFHGVSADSKCALVKWRVRLRRDATTKQPTTFKIRADYGFIDEKTNMVLLKGTNAFQGKWRMKTGTPSDPRAVVYELESNKPGVSLRLLEMDESVLQVLNENGSLMIGDEFQSYTLNRAKPE